MHPLTENQTKQHARKYANTIHHFANASSSPLWVKFYLFNQETSFSLDLTEVIFSAECTIAMVRVLTSLKHCGTMALWHYGTMALWHYSNKVFYYTTQAVRGPITKINQSKCSIAGPIFSKYWTGHCPEWSRTCVFAFFSRVINLLLTKLAWDRTGRISALGLFCLGPYWENIGPRSFLTPGRYSPSTALALG